MKVYLDTNIFVYLENGSLTVPKLEEIVNSKIDKIFFSASHIQETLEIKGENEQQRNERINIRLNTIEKITQGNYINDNLNHEVFEYIESPFEVLKTITEVSFGQSMMKGLANLIGEEQRIELRKILNLDPKRINNYRPEEVVEQLNKKLSQTGQDITFLGMIEKGISYHPDGKSFGRSNRFAGIFELLDMLGYWKDKATHKSNYARLWDSSHAFYASHCNYFITDDKKTRNKTKVVYNIYNIGTKVISSKNKT